MKKLLAAALAAACLTLTLLPASALAEEHRFVRTTEDPEDDWVCAGCGAVITAVLKKGYDAALTLDGRVLPGDVEENERAVRAYTESLAQEVLDRAGWYTTDVSKISYTAPANGRSGEYRYTVTVRSYGRSNPLLADITTPALTLVLPARRDSDPAVRDDGKSDQNSGSGGWTASAGAPGYYSYQTNVYPYSWAMGVSQDKDYAAQRRETLMRVFWYAWTSRNHSTMEFTDVPRDSWYYPGVSHVWFNSLMSGVSADRFAPDEPASRAMVWTVLARMSGASVSAAEGQQWYEPGTQWAVSRGLCDGTDPMGGVTREYLANMLWRLAGGPMTPADLSGFSDRDQVSSYASGGVQWAVSKGLLQGSEGRLSPQGGVTRAELANLVMRFQMLPN